MGRVDRSHGVRGDVLVTAFSDDPARFVAGARFETNETPPRALTVREVRVIAHPTLIVGFDGITDREVAQQLRGLELTISSEERRGLRREEFWPDDLVGLQVVDPRGQVLGRVIDVVLGAAQDRLVVELTGGGQIEVPFVDELVPEVDREKGSVTIIPISGLLN